VDVTVGGRGGGGGGGGDSTAGHVSWGKTKIMVHTMRASELREGNAGVDVTVGWGGVGWGGTGGGDGRA
jgi:hypothetical protein